MAHRELHAARRREGRATVGRPRLSLDSLPDTTASDESLRHTGWWGDVIHVFAFSELFLHDMVSNAASRRYLAWLAC